MLNVSREVFESVIERFGVRHQINVAMGECAELIAELQRHFNQEGRETDVNKVAEEIADVEIMMDQLRMILNKSYQERGQEFGDNLVEAIKLAKIRRLEGILYEGE